MSNADATVAEITAAPRSSARLQRVALVLAGVGGLLSLLALLGEASRPRLGFAYLWGFVFVWTIVLGSLFFVGLHHITHARWSVVVRRVAEMLASPMAMLAALFVPILLFLVLNGQFHLFEWADASHVEHDHVLHGKKAYLNVPFFIARAVFFFAIWIGFARLYIGNSLRQDEGDDCVAWELRLRKWSPAFIMLFGLSASFAGIDWLMSLSPHWFSTIFGVYVFSGMVLAALAAVTLSTLYLQRTGRVPENAVNSHHYYNLGALMFAFTCFWAYIAFSQYMLIWYANIPEESFYLVRRLEGGWLKVSIALGLIRFVIPFFLLLARRAKMNTGVLFWASWLVLAGQLLDLYWLIMPEMHESAPVLGWQEAGPVLLLVGALLYGIDRFISRHRALAVGDPMLESSLQFHL